MVTGLLDASLPLKVIFKIAKLCAIMAKAIISEQVVQGKHIWAAGCYCYLSRTLSLSIRLPNDAFRTIRTILLITNSSYAIQCVVA
jgi:hypothetical protein